MSIVFRRGEKIGERQESLVHKLSSMTSAAELISINNKTASFCLPSFQMNSVGSFERSLSPSRPNFGMFLKNEIPLDNVREQPWLQLSPSSLPDCDWRPETPQHPERPCGLDFPSTDTNSSSFSVSSLSCSCDDQSGASSDEKDNNAGDMEADSPPSPSSTEKFGSLRKRSLSSHFNGKSRSFTSLADAAGIQSIQDLAKPENPYAKRRRVTQNSLLVERRRSFPLRSIEGTINKKKSLTKGGGSLAAALAMTVANNVDFMDTLTEECNEENCSPSGSSLLGEQSHNRSNSLPSRDFIANGFNGVAVQDSWANRWIGTPQKSSLLRRYDSRPDFCQMVE